MTKRPSDQPSTDKPSAPCHLCGGTGKVIVRGSTDGNEWTYACHHNGTLAPINPWQTGGPGQGVPGVNVTVTYGTPRSAGTASTMDELRAKYKAASHEERQRLIHEHDCPRVWDFWRKHSSGSKLCPSCLMCGQQSFDRADWAITHLELPDIYICKGCVDKTRTPQSAIEASIPVALLREHWLHAIECNHETKQDMPICACSKVNLGWHPSVGAAVEVWIKHVQEAAR